MNTKFSSLSLLFSVVVVVVLHFAAAAAVERYSRADFPADFVFGSGTAAYQYEGAANEDGRTPSFWDTFDHLSCAAGRGAVNPKGLQYYNNLINELVRNGNTGFLSLSLDLDLENIFDHAGIEPHLTLHHIDLPQVLQDEYEGWLSTKIVEEFTAYAEVCFREFGDRVMHWTTVNEANIFTMGGYDEGTSAPGRCSSCAEGNSSIEPYIVGHNILLAHSAVVRLYKEKYEASQRGYVGFNIYVMWTVPYTNSKEDILATRRANDFLIGWFINPLVFGDYPEITSRAMQQRMSILYGLGVFTTCWNI